MNRSDAGSSQSADERAHDIAPTAAPKRNYAAFDSELTHQALNFQLFMRLLGWLKPYRVTLCASLFLVLVAATTSVLLPVIIGRVVIDWILVPSTMADQLPDYGLIDATQAIGAGLAIEPLTAAGIVYIVLVLAQAVFMFGHRLTLTSCSLKALRDLRLDLFRTLERKPASFFDHVGVGRVMTRIGNDIENLFQLLAGFGMLAGEFVPFFLALFLMLHISGELTGIVALALPVAVLGTYLFRVAMQETFRLIRNSVSALNQYMQEDLSGIEVVQLSGREAANIEA